MGADLDPQELLEHEYEPGTDLPAEDEQDQFQDDGYEPELDTAVTFEADGWPADELVLADIDDETGEG